MNTGLRHRNNIRDIAHFVNDERFTAAYSNFLKGKQFTDYPTLQIAPNGDITGARYQAHKMGFADMTPIEINNTRKIHYPVVV